MLQPDRDILRVGADSGRLGSLVRRGVAVGLMVALSGCITQTVNTFEPDAEKALQAHIDLGLGYIRNGELALAKTKLNRALEIDPKSAAAHMGFGLLFQLENDDESAEEFFRKAIRLDPDYAAARNNYGALLYRRARYHDAIEQFQASVKDRFYGARPQAYENLGVCYVKTGEIGAAIDAFEHALNLNPGQPRSLLELADLTLQRKDYPKAKDYYEGYLGFAQHTARSLLIGIRIAQVYQDRDDEASLAMMLKNIFPRSEEYRIYQDTIR